MSFTIFDKNKKTDANAIFDNFSHAFSGDLLPRGGASLSAVDATYNLGDSDYYWDNAFLNNCFAEGETQYGMFNLVAEFGDLSLSNTVAIDFTGLNYDEYLICGVLRIRNTTTTSPMGVIFNYDSGTNYGFCGYSAESTTTNSIYSSSYDMFRISFLYPTTASQYHYFNLFLRADSDKNKYGTGIASSKYYSSIRARFIKLNSSAWANDSDTLTSLKFFVTTTVEFVSNTSIKIYARLKNE